jgi:phosphate transport system permease protein
MSMTTPPPSATPPHAEWGRVRQSRRTADRAMKLTAAGFTFIAIFVLFWILGMLIVKGIGGLSLATFTQNTPPPGSMEGGLLNAIVGSIIMTVPRRRHRRAARPVRRHLSRGIRQARQSSPR